MRTTVVALDIANAQKSGSGPGGTAPGAPHDASRTLADVLAMVRETMASIAGDHDTFDETLASSAERFERLAGVNDLQQLQAQLFEEVATLKRVTIERRRAWEKTTQEFGARLTSLESQLDDTRRSTR